MTTGSPQTLNGSDDSRQIRHALLIAFVVALAGVAVGVAISPLYTAAGLLGAVAFAVACSERRLKYVIIALALYTPFEAFLLNFAPQSLYVLARFAFYGFLAAAFAAILMKRAYEGRLALPRTPIDVPLLAFGCVSIVSLIINRVGVNEAAVAYQPFLRFIVLGFYILFYIDFSQKDARTLTRLMFAAVIVEGVIGLAQSAIGARAGVFLAPKGAEFGETVIAGTTQIVYGRYQIFGTLGRYQTLGAFMGMFLLLSYPYIKRRSMPRARLILMYVVAIPCIVLAASRGPWLGAVVGFWVLMAVQRKPAAAFIPLVGVISLALLYLAVHSYETFVGWEEASAAQRLLEVFSPTYWKVVFDKAGRLYYCTTFFYDVFNLGLAKFLFGFGPGTLGYTATGVFGRYTLSAVGVPQDWQNYITDVNWAYIFGQTGILGLGCIVWACYRLFRHAYAVYRDNNADDDLRDLALGFLGMFGLFMATAFFYPMFEIRALSFYFWLYAGIIVKLAAVHGRAPSTAVPTNAS